MTAAASGSGGRLLDRPRSEGGVRGEETLDGGSRLAETHVTTGHSVETLISPPDLFDGAYELIDLMGQGAMGEVWRARNVNLDKEVAIKLVKLQSSHPSLDIRLRNEARLAAKMSHPNVVGVYDTGVTGDGRYYLVMELLEGHDLRQVLEQRQALPAIEAVQILLPALAGLECAHRRKILHRDIKPENIFLARTEERVVPKLVDFGIALARDLPNEARSTRSGALLGTPLYMAPEQARGALDLDERADIWAVTTVLYELISGQVPFSSDDTHVLFSRIASEAVPPLDESLCDAGLTAILERGLAKDPAERWSGARDMAGALVTWLLAHGVTEDVSGEPLEKLWLSGSVRPARLAAPSPSSETLHIVPPAAPDSAAPAPVRLPLSRFQWSLAAVALGFLALVLLALSESRTERPTEVSSVVAVATPSDEAPPRVEVVIPAPVFDPLKSENPVLAPASGTQSLRKGLEGETQERSVPSAVDAEDEVPPAPAPATTAPAPAPATTAPAPAPATTAPAPAPATTVRRSQVDPTWGF